MGSFGIRRWQIGKREKKGGERNMKASKQMNGRRKASSEERERKETSY